MRKIISKRGFTIVEVLVAFVIFAIMAGMVSMILAQTNVARQNNNDIMEEIENQKEVYYLKDHEKKYDSSEKSGDLTFNFDGLSPLSIGYNIGDPNADTDENVLALEYFVGDVKYDSLKNQHKDNKNDAGNSVGSVLSRLDSRVYGSTGVKDITFKISKDESYTGTGYRYFLQSFAIFTGLEQQKWFAQYRIIFPSVILDYGYTDQNGSNANIKSRFETSTLPFEVYSPYNRTLMISSKQSSSESSPPVISGKYLYYYVTLSEPLENIDASLDMNKIFGYSDTKQTSTKTESGSYVFNPYQETITDEDGNTSTVSYPNVFGAFPKEEEETPSA